MLSTTGNLLYTKGENRAKTKKAETRENNKVLVAFHISVPVHSRLSAHSSPSAMR